MLFDLKIPEGNLYRNHKCSQTDIALKEKSQMAVKKEEQMEGVLHLQ